MCGVLDANAAGIVFKEKTKFFDWFDTGTGSLVAGGKMLKELDKILAFTAWRKQARLAGRIRILNTIEVNKEASRVAKDCKSDDPSVIAVARIGGARLLHSFDKNLQQDFKNKKLIDSPRGKVYTTGAGVQARLLRQRNLCKGAKAK